MMWAVLAAALAAVFLLGGLRVGLRGEYTPETAGAWLRVGPTEFRLFPRQEEKKPDRPKKARQEGTGGGKQPRPPFLSRRGLLELGRRLFPLLLEAAGQFRRKLQIDELRLRLKYAGVDETKIQVYYDYDPLIDAMCASEYPVFIMPTYTSMLDLRGRLQKQLGGKEFWE